MTHSDELVERVARAIREQYEAEYEEDPGDWWCEQLARAALSALPSHELLREALEALQVFADLLEPEDEGRPDNWMQRVFLDLRSVRRARATAEKLRASLTQDQP